MIATELGAEFRWAYDNFVTHFVHQVNKNDKSDKEFKKARDDNAYVIFYSKLIFPNPFKCQDSISSVAARMFIQVIQSPRVFVPLYYESK